jgi:hypothetical protein
MSKAKFYILVSGGQVVRIDKFSYLTEIVGQIKDDIMIAAKHGLLPLQIGVRSIVFGEIVEGIKNFNAKSNKFIPPVIIRIYADLACSQPIVDVCAKD